MIRAADSRARIASGARGAFEVVHYERPADLLSAAADPDIALVVIDAADREGNSQAGIVGAIHAAFESLPILVYCAPAELARGIPGLVRAGAADIILKGVDDVGIALRGVLRAGRRAALRCEIYDELAPLLPMPITPLLRHALECTDADASVRAAAVALGVDRKTLRNWLWRATGLSPREFINFVRLAVAVGMLHDNRQTAERVALDLGFPSGAGFRNMLHRYTGRSSSEFGGKAGLAAILQLLKQRIATRNPSEALVADVNKPLIRMVSP